MKDFWINVNDGLPDNENYVLVYLADGDYDFAWYSKIRKKWFWNQFDKIDRVNLVTHWQPLEKPK